MADRDPEVQALLDKKAIEEVLLKFLRGCDRGDPELVERAYWPDGWEDHGGTFDGPASEWVAVVKERLPKAGLMNHLAMNMVIDLTGATTAVAETYILTASRLTVKGQEFDTRTLARCVDHMEKRGAEWRIKRRNMCWEWNEEHELSETWARGAITRDPSLLRRGGKKPDDILYTPAA
jgi:hypothetical protein